MIVLIIVGWTSYLSTLLFVGKMFEMGGINHRLHLLHALSLT